jgi:hypothetical protein
LRLAQHDLAITAALDLQIAAAFEHEFLTLRDWPSALMIERATAAFSA